MTLPAAPPITLLQALAEYGIPAGYTLGHLVDQPGMPTDYPISLLDCLGKSNIVLTPFAGSISETIAGGNSQAGFQIRNTGVQESVKTSGTTSLGAWISPAGLVAQTEYMMTLLSGTLPSGTFGSWINGATGLAVWSLLRSTVGTVTCSMRLDMRRTDGGGLVSGVINLSATRT